MIVPYSDQENFMARQSEPSFGQGQVCGGQVKGTEGVPERAAVSSGLLLTCGAQARQEASMGETYVSLLL